MKYQKGQSGNPGGRPKDKPWAEALRVSLYRDDRRALTDLAEVVKLAALGGDMQAIKEIGDRLDGKPVQESEVTVHRAVSELTDEEIAARIAELRGAGASDGDGASPVDPQKLN